MWLLGLCGGGACLAVTWAMECLLDESGVISPCVFPLW